MERRSFLKQAGIAGILAAGAAPAAHAQQAIRWRLASGFPKAFDTLHGAAETFARKVKEMSGGRFDIALHAPDKPTPTFSLFDNVQRGIVECAHVAPCHLHGKDETFSIDCAIPFGLNARQMNAWMHQGNGLRLMREFYAHFNVVNFPMGNTGASMGGWYRREIKNLQDLKGLKMRLPPLAGAVAARLGVVSPPMSDDGIVTALEKGTIGAAAWGGPYDDRKLGLDKAARFYAYPAWWEGGQQLALYVNGKAYDALTAENKAILECATALVHADIQARYDVRNAQALRQLVAGGTRLFRMPRTVMEAAFKAAGEEYAALSARNPNWKKVFADYAVFRREQNQWFRHAEAAFDGFMQSRKNL